MANNNLDGLGALFSNGLIREIIADQATSQIRKNGVRLGEAGLEKMKNMDSKDILNVAESIFGTFAQATAPKTSETPREEPRERVAEESVKIAPEPSPEAPAPAAPIVVEVEVAPVKETLKEEGKVSEALAVLEAVFSGMTPAGRDTAIASVMRLVEAASDNGLTGEHAGWIARLYGNHQI
ncbi:MAG: hypothetical protein H9W81_04255 [Enterococcus sp.]|nr:hypothetical protein [Enterococcus sp.]